MLGWGGRKELLPYGNYLPSVSSAHASLDTEEINTWYKDESVHKAIPAFDAPLFAAMAYPTADSRRLLTTTKHIAWGFNGMTVQIVFLLYCGKLMPDEKITLVNQRLGQGSQWFGVKPPTNS